MTTRPFTVLQDAAAPTLSLSATVQGNDALVTWNVEDSGSGVDASSCRLEVREDEGAWQPFSTECAGDDTYNVEPGHTYTFRLTASDNVSNADSLEVEAVVPYVTKYYYANGKRVAMRRGSVVYYLHGDHLRSTSLVTDQAGNKVAEQRYEPWGVVRWQDGTMPTDFAFTGQRAETFGLLDYNARYYSPLLQRFISADTIVPSPGDPQSLNRYSYVRNNPVLYRDPSGHAECIDAECRRVVHPITRNVIQRRAAPRTPSSIYDRRTPTIPTPRATPTLPSGPPAPQATGMPIPTPTPTIAGGAYTGEDKSELPTGAGQEPVRRGWPFEPEEKVVPWLPNPHIPLSGRAAEINAEFVLGWDIGAALITTGGWFIVGLDTLVAPADPAGKAFGYALAQVGSASATVTLLDTLVTSGPNSQAFTVSALTYSAGWTSLVWAVPIDLAAAWTQVAYDAYTLQRIQRQNQR